MLFTSSFVALNAQVWSESFTAGGYDSNNELLGGSEVLQLIGHKNMLFASVGYWQDGNNIWYGGSNNNIGWGQINRLDNPLANWQEDFFLVQIIFALKFLNKLFSQKINLVTYSLLQIQF